MSLLPQIAESAARTRTGWDIRLERMIHAGEAFYAARSHYHVYEGDDDAEEERLCGACSKARLAFAQACESFFLNRPARLP